MFCKLENNTYLCGDQVTYPSSQLVGKFFAPIAKRHYCYKSFASRRYPATREGMSLVGIVKADGFLFIPISNFSLTMTKDTKICRSCDDSARDARNASEKATITFNKSILRGLFCTLPPFQFGMAVGIAANGLQDDDVKFLQGKDVQLAVDLLTAKLN